jgi:hypothetical protein
VGLGRDVPDRVPGASGGPAIGAFGDSAQLAAGIDADLVETIGHSGSFAL